MAYLIGTAGHVDHGKTTLIARLTGIDTDRLPEEKARGMTIDLGYAYVELEGVGRVSIVDVPGHERFIKNMLAGASGVDVAVLCVAADEGVMPQTREHFQILQLLEARKLIVALNKCDIVDEDEQDLAQLDVADLLKGTAYEASPVVRVSAMTGQGLHELRTALKDAIRSLGDRKLSSHGWLLPIDRVFTIAGHGTVVTGTLAHGSVSAGTEGVLMPGGHKLRVRSVQTHGEAAERAEAGQRTALNVSGVKKEDLHRGQAIGAPGFVIESECINVRLAPIREFKHGERVRIHIGAGEFLGKLFTFDAAPNFAQVRLESPIACAQGQRIVIRKYSPPEILAGGEIVTPLAKVRRKKDASVTELFAERGSKEWDAQILAELERRPFGAETAVICEALGQTPQALGSAFEQLKQDGLALGFAGRWISASRLAEIAHVVRRALSELHQASPRSAAISKATVLAASKLDWDAKAFDRLTAKLAADGLIVLHGGDVRHPDFKIALTEKQQSLLERVLDIMHGAGASAPHPAEMADELKVPQQAVEEILRLGLETGDLVRVGDELVYARKTLEELKLQLRKLGERFTVAQFRDLTGSSRKYALPLLEHFDSEKFTRRLGDERIIVGALDK